MAEQSEIPVPVEDKPKPVEDRPQNQGRRNFLKGLVGLAGLAAIGQIPDTRNVTPPQTEDRERLLGKPKLIIIDVDPNIPNEELVSQALGDRYVSKDRLKTEFGEDYDKRWGEIAQKYPKALMHAFADNYLSHGQQVSEAAQKFWERETRKDKKAEVIPLQRIFGKESIKAIKDADGNPGISVNFDPKKVIELLKNNQDQVVNMSFQVGNVDLFAKQVKSLDFESRKSVRPPLYEEDRDMNIVNTNRVYLFPPDGYSIQVLKEGILVPADEKGNPLPSVTKDEYDALVKQDEERIIKEGGVPTLNTTEMVSAYSDSKVEENLPKLFEVCNAYPDKLFVAAAGNEGEDLRRALGGKPKNLLIVGQWSTDIFDSSIQAYPTHNVYGADIYIDNKAEQLPNGSSFSAPYLAAYASSLMGRGLPMEQAIQTIKAKSMPKTYRAKSEAAETKALVSHPDFDPLRLAK